MEKTEKASLVSSSINLILLVFKFLVAFLSGSIAIKADAIHSLTDSVSSFAVFAGLKISKRKSKNFPYGLHKVENLISLLIAFFIFWAGYEIMKEIFLAPTPEIKNLYLALSVSLLAFCVSFILSVYKIKVGARTNSPSLLADGHHSRTDAFSSLVVFIGLSGHLVGLQIEKFAAVVVIFFILKSGFAILVESVKVLLDASLDFNTLNQISQIIRGESKVGEIRSLVGRSSGRYRFVEADLTLKVREIEKAHRTVELLEKKIKKEIPFVDHIRIHYEPLQKNVNKYAVPLASPEGRVSEHFGDAPYFALIEVDAKTKNILSEHIISNAFLSLEKGKGIAVAEELIKRDIDYLIIAKRFEGKGPQYVLSDSSVEVMILAKNSLQDTLSELGITKKVL